MMKLAKPAFGVAAAGALALAQFAPTALAHTAEEDTTTVMVMSHLCNSDVRTKMDFEDVEELGGNNPVAALAQTVLACPTIRNVGDNAEAGTVAGANLMFEYDIVDAHGTVHPWSEGMFMQKKLCESDLNLDANGDGEISANVCLDVSHYEFDVPAGPVTVIQHKPASMSTFGALRFTPSVVDGNNDENSLVKTYMHNGTIVLDTEEDTDDMVMLHVYNFPTGAMSSSSSSSSNSVSSRVNRSSCYLSATADFRSAMEIARDEKETGDRIEKMREARIEFQMDIRACNRNR